MLFNELEINKFSTNHEIKQVKMSCSETQYIHTREKRQPNSEEFDK